jgi:CO/xanthine dehydrogenase Mo-binding subunit
MRDVHFADCLEKVAARSGWAESRAGKGLAVVMKGMQTPSRAGIAVETDGEGFVLRCATAEMGQGVKTALRLHASELLGVPPEKIRFPDPDTDLVPYDTRATSSRSTYMMTGALAAAVADLRRDGERGFGEFHNHGGLDPDTGQGIASSHWHQGACAASIDVDEETGRVRVRDLQVATYAGTVVNPHGAEHQSVGSMTMGLGSALLESVSFTDGQVTNPNLSDYQIPAITDLPAMGHELLTRVGAEVHGLGETAVPPVPAAIGNALASLGIHVNELPITSEAVLLAIDGSEGIRR